MASEKGVSIPYSSGLSFRGQLYGYTQNYNVPVSIPYSSGRQRYALKGLGTKGQRDKVIEKINLFFVVSFRLTHLTSSSSTFLYLYIPTSLITTSLRRRRSIPSSSGLSFRLYIYRNMFKKIIRLNPLFIRSQFQMPFTLSKAA